MPSWDVHEKYARLMGIPIEIAKEINRLVDDPRWHDFFDIALERVETPNLRAIGGRIIIYYFRGSIFYTPTWESFRKAIDRYGDDGWKSFFLHIWLDLIERNMHSGKGFAIIGLEATDFYRYYIDEVSTFLKKRGDEVLDDIRNYIIGRRMRKEKILGIFVSITKARRVILFMTSS